MTTQSTVIAIPNSLLMRGIRAMKVFAMKSPMNFGRKRNIYPVIFSLAMIVMIWTIAECISDRWRHQCYQFDGEFDSSIEILEDISFSERQPRNGKSIFFHETSCTAGNVVRLNARQACAIESAARWNPNFDVFLLFASPVGFKKNSAEMAPVINALKSYSNIHMRHVDLWSYANHTPFADWLSTGDLFYSKYLISHTSDFLRYMSMYKFGGIYMDLDVVVQKSFENIEPNFTGAESSKEIAAGIMSFEHTGIGHRVAEMCMKEFIEKFRGDAWIDNGPGVITRVLHKICGTKNPAEMTSARCGGFRVYQPREFYAVRWQEWRNYFNQTMTKSILNVTQDSLAVHVWNKLSTNEIVEVGSNVAYEIIAAKNCPHVFRTSGKYF